MKKAFIGQGTAAKAGTNKPFIGQGRTAKIVISRPKPKRIK